MTKIILLGDTSHCANLEVWVTMQALSHNGPSELANKRFAQ
jgi:hypothetical protein